MNPYLVGTPHIQHVQKDQKLDEKTILCTFFKKRKKTGRGNFSDRKCTDEKQTLEKMLSTSQHDGGTWKLKVGGSAVQGYSQDQGHLGGEERGVGRERKREGEREGRREKKEREGGEKGE